MSSFGVIEKGGKFIVTKNGDPILLPKSDGSNIVTEFSSKEDAQKYISILERLSKQKKYQQN
jgi:hypothetical protein